MLKVLVLGSDEIFFSWSEFSSPSESAPLMKEYCSPFKFDIFGRTMSSKLSLLFRSYSHKNCPSWPHPLAPKL